MTSVSCTNPIHRDGKLVVVDAGGVSSLFETPTVWFANRSLRSMVATLQISREPGQSTVNSPLHKKTFTKWSLACKGLACRCVAKTQACPLISCITSPTRVWGRVCSSSGSIYLTTSVRSDAFYNNFVLMQQLGNGDAVPSSSWPLYRLGSTWLARLPAHGQIKSWPVHHYWAVSCSSTIAHSY